MDERGSRESDERHKFLKGTIILKILMGKFVTTRGKICRNVRKDGWMIVTMNGAGVTFDCTKKIARINPYRFTLLFLGLATLSLFFQPFQPH